MSDAPSRIPTGAQPHPDHAGWYHWPDIPAASFAGQTGLILFREDGGLARVRMFPTEKHLNMGGSIHGGAVMSFIDMALFAGGRIAGMGEGHYVTLDCATHFIARGRIDAPLDAVVRLVGETKGGHVFLSGHCEQDGQPTHSFTGTLKRIRERS
ncbi:MAG: PaaI family thioesterase [Pseudomonadota bacterium]|nr:PaaI family thioesterase [Pseudomonadota bacterium]